MTGHDIEVVSYEALAEEYYDSARHPTCSNFGLASKKLLLPWLESTFAPGERVCEVGPGRSLVAEWLSDRDEPLSSLCLVESSLGMARHSSDWIKAGAQLFHADARHMPLDDNAVSVVVASLGDPYNDLGFWREARRVLRPSGVLLFSTPAYEWAQSFRQSNGSALDLAEFELSDGSLVGVRSLVKTENDQIAMAEEAGLAVTKVAHATVRDLGGERLSPKLTIDGLSQDRIVTAYYAVAE